MKQGPLDPEEMDVCLELLQRMSDNLRALPENERFSSLVCKLYVAGKKRRRDGELDRKARKRKEDRELLARSQLVQIQSDDQRALPPPQGTWPEAQKLHNPEDCYVCKQPYRDVHFFYHFLCPDCAALNYRMRDLHSDLTGRTALVTGGRVKIGYQLVLRLLQDGARVIVTTRFPNAAAHRFSLEPGFEQWGERLQLYGLDLRNLPAVEAFAAHMLDTEPELNIVIHNAAQTIQRASGFYRELAAQEERPEDTLSLPAQRLVAQPTEALRGSLTAALPDTHAPTLADVLPLAAMHDWEERVDQRNVNSWLLPIEQVGPREMLEVQLVNAVAPFLLNGRLKPLLLRSHFERRFIVNVSAMEGQFSRHKTPNHPHTNMAKAALNMMTHTCAESFARDRIYMNSVDTGWITDENPTPMRQRKQEELGFFAPLDVVDGMARVYHPVAAGVSDPSPPLVGQFLKDYAPCRW